MIARIEKKNLLCYQMSDSIFEICENEYLEWVFMAWQNQNASGMTEKIFLCFPSKQGSVFLKMPEGSIYVEGESMLERLHCTL